MLNLRNGCDAQPLYTSKSHHKQLPRSKEDHTFINRFDRDSGVDRRNESICAVSKRSAMRMHNLATRVSEPLTAIPGKLVRRTASMIRIKASKAHHMKAYELQEFGCCFPLYSLIVSNRIRVKKWRSNTRPQGWQLLDYIRKLPYIY